MIIRKHVKEIAGELGYCNKHTVNNEKRITNSQIKMVETILIHFDREVMYITQSLNFCHLNKMMAMTNNTKSNKMLIVFVITLFLLKNVLRKNGTIFTSEKKPTITTEQHIILLRFMPVTIKEGNTKYKITSAAKNKISL